MRRLLRLLLLLLLRFADLALLLQLVLLLLLRLALRALLGLLLLLGFALRSFLLLLHFARLLLRILPGLAASRGVDRGSDGIERIVLRTAQRLRRRLIGGSLRRHRRGSVGAREGRARDQLITHLRGRRRPSWLRLLRGLGLQNGRCCHGGGIAVRPAADQLVSLRQHLLHLRGRDDLLLAQRVQAHLHARAFNRPAIDERFALHHGRAAVAVIGTPVFVAAVPLAWRKVAHSDVDAVGIRAIRAIPGLITVRRRERIPADDRCRGSGARAHVPVGAAHPTDQGRGPCRSIDALPRAPRPTIAHVHPAPVMEGRITPRGLVDPGPAPGAHVAPVTGAIGRPIGGDACREPERAVAGLLHPFAVAIELLVARHVGGHVAARAAVGPVSVAGVGPAVERVYPGALGDIGGRRAAEYPHGVAGRDADAPALRFHACVAREYREARLFALRIRIDAIAPVGQDGEARVRGGKRDAMVRLLVAHANARAAALDARVDLVLVEARDVELGQLVQADRGGAHAQFRARAALGPDRVFRRDGGVDVGLVPTEVGILVHRDGALGVGEPADAAGRFLRLREPRDRRDERQQEESDIAHVGHLSDRAYPLLIRGHYLNARRPRPDDSFTPPTTRNRTGSRVCASSFSKVLNSCHYCRMPRREKVAGAVTAGSRGE